jgi:peptidoglycan/xylan/chitin deacetylase (PgdA/CDA1 family)
MRATFFMVGNLMASNPDIVKNVYDNKMEIGSHSWAHKNLKKQKLDVITSEMMQTDNVYKNITGDKIKLMRPPYGAINGTVKDAFNYSYILWNVDTNDWKYKDADHLYDFVLNNVEDGDIVLMHDLQYTTKVGLEKLLPELYARGYRVVTVSELANIKGKTLQAKSIYKSMK